MWTPPSRCIGRRTSKFRSAKRFLNTRKSGLFGLFFFFLQNWPDLRHFLGTLFSVRWTPGGGGGSNFHVIASNFPAGVPKNSIFVFKWTPRISRFLDPFQRRTFSEKGGQFGTPKCFQSTKFFRWFSRNSTKYPANFFFGTNPPPVPAILIL